MDEQERLRRIREELTGKGTPTQEQDTQDAAQYGLTGERLGYIREELGGSREEDPFERQPVKMNTPKKKSKKPKAPEPITPQPHIPPITTPPVNPSPNFPIPLKPKYKLPKYIINDYDDLDELIGKYIKITNKSNYIEQELYNYSKDSIILKHLEDREYINKLENYTRKIKYDLEDYLKNK